MKFLLFIERLFRTVKSMPGRAPVCSFAPYIRRRRAEKIVSGLSLRTQYVSPAMQKPQSSQMPCKRPGHSSNLVPSASMKWLTQQSFGKSRFFMIVRPDRLFMMG